MFISDTAMRGKAGGFRRGKEGLERQETGGREGGREKKGKEGRGKKEKGREERRGEGAR